VRRSRSMLLGRRAFASRYASPRRSALRILAALARHCRRGCPAWRATPTSTTSKPPRRRDDHDSVAEEQGRLEAESSDEEGRHHTSIGGQGVAGLDIYFLTILSHERLSSLDIPYSSHALPSEVALLTMFQASVVHVFLHQFVTCPDTT
jgi:hypothetical protein